MPFATDKSRRAFFAKLRDKWKEKIGPREKELIAKTAIATAIGAGVIGGGLLLARRAKAGSAAEKMAQTVVAGGVTATGIEAKSTYDRIRDALKSPVRHVKKVATRAQDNVIEATALGSAAAHHAVSRLKSGVRTLSFGDETPETLGARALDFGAAKAEDMLRRRIEQSSDNLSHEAARLVGKMQAAGVREVIRTGEKGRAKLKVIAGSGEVTADERMHMNRLNAMITQNADDKAKLRRLREVSEKPLEEAVKETYKEMIRQGRFNEAQRGNWDEKLLAQNMADRGLQMNEDRMRRGQTIWGVLTTSGSRVFDILRA